MKDSEIFDGKSLKDLFRNIFENQVETKTEISALVTTIAQMIKKPDDVVMLGPVIQQFVDTSVKNDEQLVKMANVIQRVIAVESKVTDGGDGMMLSEQERETLLKNALSDMTQTVDIIQDELDSAKSKI